MNNYNMSDKKEKLNILFVLYLIFNILFPKSGIKINGIPLTIGSVIYIVILPISIILFAYRGYKLYKTEIIIIYSIIYWTLRLALLHENVDTSQLLSFFSCLCVYPLIYFVVPVFINTDQKISHFIRIVNLIVTIIMIYSIIQGVFGIDKTTIPGLSVNYNDYINNPNNWWMLKNNSFNGSDFSGSYKIVSTYQNGNLFGVNLLLFFPITYYSAKNKRTKLILLILFLISCILCGSRTIYITIIFYGFVLLFKFVVFSNKISKEAILCSFLVPIMILYMLQLNSDILNRVYTIFDVNVLKNGSGRVSKITNFILWFKQNGNVGNIFIGSWGNNYNGPAGEVLFVCLFILGGVIGLVLFIYTILEIYKYTFKLRCCNDLAKGINIGLTLYIIASISDGGYWLPPTALNLWLLLSLAKQIKINKNGDLKR